MVNRRAHDSGRANIREGIFAGFGRYTNEQGHTQKNLSTQNQPMKKPTEEIETVETDQMKNFFYEGGGQETDVFALCETLETQRNEARRLAESFRDRYAYCSEETDPEPLPWE
jgi:hypothetical protein